MGNTNVRLFWLIRSRMRYILRSYSIIMWLTFAGGNHVLRRARARVLGLQLAKKHGFTIHIYLSEIFDHSVKFESLVFT